MDNHVRKQHYVPQFVLRNFLSKENFIWSYDKKWNSSKERSISSVAYEEYFYDKIKGQKEGSLEYFFVKAETDTAPIISKIIQERSLNALTLEEKIVIAMFIILQLNRTKTALKDSEEISEKLMESMQNFAAESEIKINFGNNNPKEVWRSIFKSTPYFTEILLQKKWVLLESNKMFYTSDNPVVRANYTYRNSIRGVLGLKSKGIEIYFPLGDSLILCLYCEKTFEMPKNTLCKIENIEYFNSLQILNSDRYVFSSQNNFELAKDILKQL